MELKTAATWVQKYLQLTHQFNADIIGLPIPETPSRLDPDRKKWAEGALSEELTEFIDADTLEDEVDALLDLVYFALGRVIEMGIVPGAAFEEIHATNMGKVRGELSKRPHAKGYDAVKPEGWTPPYLLPYLALDRRQVLAAYDAALSEREATERVTDHDIEPEDAGKPKLLVLGHARHGKDTVAEILQREYGFQFTSSSLFCAEHVVWAAIQDTPKAIRQHIDAGMPGMSDNQLIADLTMMRDQQYANVEDCFKDRINFRTAWFSLIAAYCHPNKERLAREIFEENDIYVGIRNKREFRAAVNAGLVDLTIWVDASERVDQEPMASCTVEPWMADVTIDNNGTEAELHHNVHQLMATLGIERIEA
ncbi:MAG: putative deoxynucleotide monophosphate kinase [Prokaryotic dsDNA virus sp.]|nr:MAG: putative deoxynucleotide monophosphate kinase [Prokaryotic dsDNA virus sp.]|tara:strand:- start:151 stop:1248 length:1098 start_codon:yes stop_codon:yes gene_type:complete